MVAAIKARLFGIRIRFRTDCVMASMRTPETMEAEYRYLDFGVAVSLSLMGIG